MKEIVEKVIEKRIKTFDMIWTYGESAKEWPDAKNIILTFADYPTHKLGIYSPDLGNYLESLKSDHVKVVFEYTYDTSLGKMVGYHAIQIGELKGWRDYSGYGGVGDEPFASK